MIRILILIISALIGNGLAGQHGLWIVRNTLNSQEDLNTLQNIDHALNITDVFLQVRALGKNQFLLDNRAELQTGSLSFKKIVNFCHQNEIKLHAWINTFYIWNFKNDPLNQDHSKFWDQNHLMTDASGVLPTIKQLKKMGVEGYFVDPDAAKNLQQIKEFIKQLILQYHVDGIHFDYFRYPAKPVWYSRYLRAKFLENFFLDPAKAQLHQNVLLKEWGAATLFYMNKKYSQFLESELSNHLSNLYEFIKKLNPNCQVSVAVKPNLLKARQLYSQNWIKWIKAGLCDYVIIMNYTSDYKEFKKNLKMAKSYKEDAHIVNGIGVYYLDKSGLVKRINDSENSGLKGYCLFSFTTLKEQPNVIPIMINNTLPKAKTTQDNGALWVK